MRLLSLTQPLATLVALNKKRIETRSFKTSYRGLVAIHASKGLAGLPAIRVMRGLSKKGGKAAYIELCQSEPFAQVLCLHFKASFSSPNGPVSEIAQGLPFGAIVAVANLSMILPTDDSFFRMTVADLTIENGVLTSGTAQRVAYEKPAPDTLEFQFGNYGPNRYMWFFENIRPLRRTVTCPGSLGLVEVPDDVKQQVMAQI